MIALDSTEAGWRRSGQNLGGAECILPCSADPDATRAASGRNRLSCLSGPCQRPPPASPMGIRPRARPSPETPTQPSVADVLPAAVRPRCASPAVLSAQTDPSGLSPFSSSSSSSSPIWRPSRLTSADEQRRCTTRATGFDMSCSHETHPAVRWFVVAPEACERAIVDRMARVEGRNHTGSTAASQCSIPGQVLQRVCRDRRASRAKTVTGEIATRWRHCTARLGKDARSHAFVNK